jgi:hypothetical protein
MKNSAHGEFVEPCVLRASAANPAFSIFWLPLPHARHFVVTTYCTRGTLSSRRAFSRKL